MRSTHWLLAFLFALASLGLVSYHSTLAMAADDGDKKPTVIILKVEKTEGADEGEEEDEDDDKRKAKRDREEDEEDDEDADEKSMKDDDEDEDDEDDKKEAKSKVKAKKKQAPKQPKEPAKEKRRQPARERVEGRRQSEMPHREHGEAQPKLKFRLAEPRREERARDERPRPEHPEGGFQFRWEDEGPRGPQREERRVGPPPEEMRRQMEQQRAQLERQREELQRRAEEMRAQVERMRNEIEERSRQVEQSRDRHQQMEQKNRALAENLKALEQQLAERTREVEKLKLALEQREKSMVELKMALAKQGSSDKPQPKLAPKVVDERAIDPALVARVERLEAEIRRLMAILKQQAQPKSEPKPTLKLDVKPMLKLDAKPKAKVGEVKPVQPLPEVKAPVQGVITLDVAPSVHPADALPSVKVVSPSGAPVIEKTQAVAPSPQAKIHQSVVAPKAEVTAPDGGTLIMGGKKYQRAPSTSGPPVIEKAPANEIPPPTPLPDPEVIPPSANPSTIVPTNAASVGGVGIVEGDVVAILPQEGKIVLKVCSWHDGKQLRADWVGQQVSINQGNMPSMKVGDHVSLDARIDGQKGLVWGGKVFQTK